MRLKPLVLLCLCAISSACASTPEVVAHYYLPRSDAAVRAVRTVGCSPDNTLHSQTTVTAATTFSSDQNARRSFDMAALDGSMNTSDIGLSFYDDGRLKGINASASGHGETIVASAVKLATLAAGIPLPFFAGREPPPIEAACTRIRKLNEDGVATFTYAVSESFASNAVRTVRLLPAPTNPDIAEEGIAEEDRIPLVEMVDRILGNICATFQPATALPVPAALREGVSTRNMVMIALRHPARVRAEVERRSGPGCAGNAVSLWSGSILVPQLGTAYQLPIPRAPFFGKQTFALSLAESGMLTTLQYGTESGAAGMLGALTAVAEAAQPDTAAERAAALQAEADLIVQQERLVRCRANPDACT